MMKNLFKMMKNLFKKGTALQFLIVFMAILAIDASSLYAQVKVGDNPATINEGAALEIESTDKGLLLPRIALDNTQSWQLSGDPVAGMQVYNTNPTIFTEVTNYPVIPGGVGVYYWDGSGWVPSKYSNGDADWLRASDDNFPSAPSDILTPIYHGGAGSQEVAVRTTETGIDKAARITTIAGYGSGTPIVANFFSENNAVNGRVAGLQTTTPHPIVFRTTLAPNSEPEERMRIRPNGFVGIGVRTPTNPLQVKGKIVAANTEIHEEAEIYSAIGGGEITLFSRTGSRAIQFEGGTNIYAPKVYARIEHNALDRLDFSVTDYLKPFPVPVTAMTIDNKTAYVGINKGNPEYQLDVEGEINASGKVRSNKMELTSDRRLKRKVLEFQNGLELVSKLKPVTYEKKASVRDSIFDRSEIGFIAQEVRKILPQLVSEGNDADKTLSLDYNSLIPILTRAIQEQQKQIEAQSVKLEVQSVELTEIKRVLGLAKLNSDAEVSK